MSSQFTLHILSAFFVGGLLVALLSFIAERSSALVAGIVLSLPSTMLVAFFFMGLTLPPASVVATLPTFFIALANALVFVLVYLSVARLSLPKGLSMLLSATIGIGAWFLLSLPITSMHWSNSWLSFAIFLGIACLIQIWFLYQPFAHGESLRFQYSSSEKFIRSLIAGTLVAFVVIISAVAGPVWGSVMTTFPAANLSALLILHRHYSAHDLFRFFRTAPIGFSTFVVYACCFMFFLPLYGTWLATLFAYALSLLYTFPLVKVLQFFNARFASPLITNH